MDDPCIKVCMNMEIRGHFDLWDCPVASREQMISRPAQSMSPPAHKSCAGSLQRRDLCPIPSPR